MPGKLSVAEARRNLPGLIREAERGKAVELTRRGEPVAVLVGHRMLTRLTAGRRNFADAYREFTQHVDLAEVGLDPDALFDGVRPRRRDAMWNTGPERAVVSARPPTRPTRP